MLFKEIFTAENGIFKIFAKNYPVRFAKIFGDTTATQLDVFCAITYGNKTCADFVTHSETENEIIITAIISTYVDNWVKIADALNSEYVPTATGTETRTKTGTLQRTGTGNETILNADKVFNDLDFTDTEKTDKTNSENNTDTYNLTETVSKSDNVQGAINSEISLRNRNNLCTQIAEKIVKCITIDIY